MTRCQDKCWAYKAKFVKGARRYFEGQKNCTVCEIFIRWDGLWCPCCGKKLRLKPKNPKYKEILKKLREEKELNPIAST